MLVKVPVVKLSRAYLPQGKGLMGYWAKLASRAAFRKGHALYCGYKNEVIPGMWSGGIVGLKSILGLKSRAQALEIMNELSALGYISYSLDPKTKKLTYQINDWVVKCSGAECSEGTVYASDGYGFNLECCTVLAYMPGIKSEFDTGYEKLETLYPDGLEKVPKRFAIDWRNKWMVQQSDYVISYVCHSFGGAAKYMELAKRKKKIVYNLANL